MHLIELHHSALHYKELTVSMVGRPVYCSVGLTWAAGVGWMERSLQLFATVRQVGCTEHCTAILHSALHSAELFTFECPQLNILLRLMPAHASYCHQSSIARPAYARALYIQHHSAQIWWNANTNPLQINMQHRTYLLHNNPWKKREVCLFIKNLFRSHNMFTIKPKNLFWQIDALGKSDRSRV